MGEDNPKSDKPMPDDVLQQMVIQTAICKQIDIGTQESMRVGSFYKALLEQGVPQQVSLWLTIWYIKSLPESHTGE